MDDEKPSGLLDALDDGLVVHGEESPKVQDLGPHPVLPLELLARLGAPLHHHPVGDDGEIAALTHHASLSERHDVVLLRKDLPEVGRSVETFVLLEDDRIVVTDRRLDETLRVRGGARINDLQAGRMEEGHLDVLRVKRSSTVATSHRPPNHQG